MAESINERTPVTIDGFEVGDTGWRESEPLLLYRTLFWEYPVLSAVTGEQVILRYFVTVHADGPQERIEEQDGFGSLLRMAIEKMRLFFDEAYHGIGHIAQPSRDSVEYLRGRRELERLGGTLADWSIPIVPIARKELV